MKWKRLLVRFSLFFLYEHVKKKKIIIIIRHFSIIINFFLFFSHALHTISLLTKIIF
jgi:hypothetical protein